MGWECRNPSTIHFRLISEPISKIAAILEPGKPDQSNIKQQKLIQIKCIILLTLITPSLVVGKNFAPSLPGAFWTKASFFKTRAQT